jgi:hypothetical protein
MYVKIQLLGTRSQLMLNDYRNVEVQHHNFDKSELHLTPEQKIAMQACWRSTISLNRRDICHKTMVTLNLRVKFHFLLVILHRSES